VLFFKPFVFVAATASEEIRQKRAERKRSRKEPCQVIVSNMDYCRIETTAMRRKKNGRRQI
jgi:hypothetical protein